MVIVAVPPVIVVAMGAPTHPRGPVVPFWSLSSYVVPPWWSLWLCPQSSSWPWMSRLVLVVMWCLLMVVVAVPGCPCSHAPPLVLMVVWCPSHNRRCGFPPWSSLWPCGAPCSSSQSCGSPPGRCRGHVVPHGHWCPRGCGCPPAHPLVPCLTIGAPQSSWWPCHGHVVSSQSSRLCGVPPAHRHGRVQ